MVKSSPGVHPKPRVGPILDSTEYKLAVSHTAHASSGD